VASWTEDKAKDEIRDSTPRCCRLSKDDAATLRAAFGPEE